MTLPAKIQASILSWVGESSAGPSEPAARGDDAATTETYQYPLLTPADLFSLSSKGLAAGSPGVVVKDGFLGREQASRAYDGESILRIRFEKKAHHDCLYYINGVLGPTCRAKLALRLGHSDDVFGVCKVVRGGIHVLG